MVISQPQMLVYHPTDPLPDMLLPSDYQPPLPPFFFFCGAFLRVAPEAAGFCCRGGTTVLAGAVEEPAADPGLGDVGGLLAVLLASLQQRKILSQYHTGPNRKDDNMTEKHVTCVNFTAEINWRLNHPSVRLSTGMNLVIPYMGYKFNLLIHCDTVSNVICYSFIKNQIFGKLS